MVPPIRTGWPSQLQIKETNSVELTVTVGQGNNVFAPPPPPKKKSSWRHYFRTTRLNEVINS